MSNARLRIGAPARAHDPPRYVDHGGEIVWRPPFECADTRMFVLVLEADGDKLDRWCDRCLNEPTGGSERWQVAGPFILLTFVDIARLTSLDPHDCDLGGMSESECGIWVPVVDTRRGRTAWTIPYIWVDIDAAMAGGREIFGFPKQMGTVTMPRGVKVPVLELESVTLKRYRDGELAGPYTVFRATPRDRRASLTTVEQDLTKALGALGASSPDVAILLAEQLLGALRVPVVLLKQFRDASNPSLACYQAIVETVNTVTEVAQVGVLPPYDVEIADLDGVPLGRELGLRAGMHPADAGFWIDFSFVAEPGEILWEQWP